MTSPTSSSCTVVLLLLLVVMNILIVTTLSVDQLVASCCMWSAWVFWHGGVSFHPVFSPVKWLSLPVIGRLFVRVWSKCTAQHRVTASKSALQLLCFFEKASVSFYKFADVISFPSNTPGAPELFLCPSAPAFLAYLAESLLERFPLHFKACWHSEPGHSNEVLANSQNLAVSSSQSCSWNVIVSEQDLAFWWCMNLFLSIACKRRKKSKTCLKSRLMKAVCRAVVQTLCPQEGKGEHKKGIVNGIQPAEASDTDAYDSSGDDFFGKQEALQRTQTTGLSWDSNNTVQLYDLAKLT